MSTQPEKYVFARLRGSSDAEAAEEAGYSGRTPKSARDLFEFVSLLGSDVPSIDELELEHDRLEARADRLKGSLLELQAEMRQVRTLMRASRVVHVRKV